MRDPSKPVFQSYRPDLRARGRELRKALTPAERKLWFEFLRSLPIRFLRQKPIDCYIVDFYCAARQLVVEIDGDSHYNDEAERYDRLRSEVLTKRGIRVLRFTNLDVMKNFERVCEAISKEVE